MIGNALGYTRRFRKCIIIFGKYYLCVTKLKKQTLSVKVIVFGKNTIIIIMLKTKLEAKQ